MKEEREAEKRAAFVIHGNNWDIYRQGKEKVLALSEAGIGEPPNLAPRK